MSLHIDHSMIIDATLYTLLLFSILTWSMIFFKLWQLIRNGYYNKSFAQRFWDAVDMPAAKRISLENVGGSLSRIAAQGFSWLEDVQKSNVKSIKFHSQTPQELLEQTLRVQVQQEQGKLENGLTLLASIGSTAPFVGLFGTVLGIMHAMQDISKSGSASLDVVAGPIGDALVATAIGIAVAVPAVLEYNFLLRRCKLHRLSMENFAEGFMHITHLHTEQPGA